MFVDTMTNKAYLEIANSPMLWAMVIPTVLAMCVQAYVFIKDAVKAGPIVGLTKEDTKTAIKAGCICSFGPGMSMFTVMIAFMAIGKKKPKFNEFALGLAMLAAIFIAQAVRVM